MSFLVQYYPGIIALCKMYKVKRLFAFGSVLTNRFTDKSDVDLVVDFDKEKVEDYFSNFFDLKYALETLLGRKVDLLEEQAIRNPYLKADIDMTKKLIYG
ncbi:MAG: nucleotidyltransferase domain-containing protein [Parabacteroides sp.]|nr:nucleotidyltransferase domain-containing protein [Parabacteroides sp.]